MPPPPKKISAVRPPQKRGAAATPVVIEDSGSPIWGILCFLIVVGVGGAWAYKHFQKEPVQIFEDNDTGLIVKNDDILDPTGKAKPDPPVPEVIEENPIIPDHDDHEDVVMTPPPPPPKPVVAKKSDAKPTVIHKKIKHIEHNPGKIADQITIDTMIVFTPELLNDTFGGSHKAMLAHFDSIINYSNENYINHKNGGKDESCKTRLRLVGLVESDTVIPLEGDQCKNALDLLANNKLEFKRNNVNKLRDECGADTVTFIFRWNKGGGGGLASVLGCWAAINFPNDGVYHHEMRHNGGWNHGDEDNWKMIARNSKAIAKWKSRRVSDNQLFVQYYGTGEEFDEE